MDIFKLIFENDLRLDALRERHTDRSVQQVTMSIEDFMKPDPTYSKFYISGTMLEQNLFGLNCLDKYDLIVRAIGSALSEYNLFFGGNIRPLNSVLEKAGIGEAIILSEKKILQWDPQSLRIDKNSNVGHKKAELAKVLESGDLVLYKEQAHQGFDLHLFSRENIYPKLFYPLRDLVSHNFRFFSINGKRIRSERQFYFETWTLDRPPHGAEEVFSSTQI
jgi:hypothetical protein